MAADQRTRAASSARGAGRAKQPMDAPIDGSRTSHLLQHKCQTAVATGAPAVFRGAPVSPGGELFDVMAGAQLGDRRVQWPCGGGDQLRELLLVVLVARGGNQEDHAGR